MVSGLVKDLVAFAFGVYLAIPSEANIGYALIEALGQTARASKSFIAMMPVFKIAVSLVGLYIIVYALAQVGEQIRDNTFV